MYNSEDYIDDKYIQLNNNNNDYGFDDETVCHYFSMKAVFGRVHYDDYILEEYYSIITFRHSSVAIGGESTYNKFIMENRYFKKLPYKSNIVLRLNLVTSDNILVENLYYVGGLDCVREFMYGQDRGTYYWYGNIELRIPGYNSYWFVLDHNFFFDAGMVEK